LPALWGQGLATEAATAARDFGFATAGLQELVGVVHPDNRASARVLEKLGMARQPGEVTVFGVTSALYVMRRPGYTAAMAISSPEQRTSPRTPAPILQRSLHEGFPVKDAEASLKFYTEVLGMTVYPRPNLGPGYWVGTPDGAVQFHIIQTDDEYRPEIGRASCRERV